MCLILFAHRSHPALPLVVAANRDERYDRPTRATHFWEDAPELLAGRDLEAGGTWMGLTRRGRFAAVTNFRNGASTGAGSRSRGELCRNFLLADTPPRDFARTVLDRGGDYAGFNLLLGDGRDLVYCENLHGELRSMEPGVYGLSNHLLDTPWPKVVAGKSRLRALLDNWHSADEADSGGLIELLGDRQAAGVSRLPDTGVGLDTERWLSPIFIRGEVYGTCSSTAIICDRDGEVKFHERQYCKEPNAESIYRFRLDPSRRE